MSDRRGRWETWQMAVVGVVVSLLLGIGLGVAGDQGHQQEDRTSPTTVAPDLPAGDDTSVERIVDGDTLAVTGGTTVRLIGIDTPESTSEVECYGREASAKLGQLIPLGQRVRLVYDVERLDLYGRTLAYVYRLPDGEFVNLTLAREGFADQLTVPPNLTHADEFSGRSGRGARCEPGPVVRV